MKNPKPAKKRSTFAVSMSPFSFGASKKKAEDFAAALREFLKTHKLPSTTVSVDEWQ